jgi:hypothetical protein
MWDASCLQRTGRKLRVDDLSIRFRPKLLWTVCWDDLPLSMSSALFHPGNVDKKEKSTAFWSFQSARSRGSVIQEL